MHVRGDSFACFLFDNEVGRDIGRLDVEDDLHPKGRVGLQTFGAAFRFKNIKVTAPDGRVLWEGLPAVESKSPVAGASGPSAGSITNTLGMKFALIPAGAFMMGSPVNDGVPLDPERPQHRVRITRPFYLGVHEVTQAQYEAVMGNNPSYFSANAGGQAEVAGQLTDRHPVESVAWPDAVAFCNKLSEKEGLKPFYELDGETARVPDWSGSGYRLPTEAEWEYGCRANSTTTYSFGNDPTEAGAYAWSADNSGGRTHPVGEKRSNPFGLFDMHGNVWEWCWDEFGDRYFDESPVDDPRGPTGITPPRRVIRGGGGVVVNEAWISSLPNARLGEPDQVPTGRPDRLPGFPRGPRSVLPMSSRKLVSGREGSAHPDVATRPLLGLVTRPFVSLIGRSCAPIATSPIESWVLACKKATRDPEDHGDRVLGQMSRQSQRVQ